MDSSIILRSLQEAKTILNLFLADDKNIEKIAVAGDIMVDALQNNKKILSCGNGGSMCDAMHFAEELSGRFRNNRKALAAMALSDASHITCVGNDYGFDYIFSRYIEAIGQTGDVLLAISTSGNSANIVLAVEAAKNLGIKTIALTGKTGGKIGSISDVEIRAPHTEFSDRAQEIHIKVIHCLIEYIEKKLNL